MIKALHSLHWPSFDDFHIYRTLLMGIATLLVLLLHIPFNIPVYSVVVSYGYIGVYIFLLVSGFGLFYALQKTPSVLSFYKKRFFRILPKYLIILTFFAILQRLPFTTYLWQISCISYFIDKPFFDWYIPSLLLLYLLSPLYKFYVIDSRHQLLRGFCLMSIFISIGFVDVLLGITTNIYKYVLVSRIPIFIMGFIVGYYCQKKYSNKTLSLIAASCVGLALIIHSLLRIWDAQGMFNCFLIVSFMTIPACYCIFIIAPFIPKIIRKFFDYCGQRSLEIFLIHMGLLHTPFLEPLLFRANKIILIAMTFALAHILHSFISYIYKKLSIVNK